MSITILTLGCDFQCSQCLDYFPSAFRILLESDEDRLLVVFNRGLILMTEVITSLLNYSKDLILVLLLSALIRFLFSAKKDQEVVYLLRKEGMPPTNYTERNKFTVFFGVILFITGNWE